MLNFQPAKQYIYYLRVWVHKEFVTTRFYLCFIRTQSAMKYCLKTYVLKNLWLIIGHRLFFHHGGIDSDTEAVAQNTLPKKQPELRGEWRRRGDRKGSRGINNLILVNYHYPLSSLWTDVLWLLQMLIIHGWTMPKRGLKSGLSAD